ncbi:MAG: tetratricopeptide repeat-containing protein [Gammaproteobacteria bacterium]
MKIIRTIGTAALLLLLVVPSVLAQGAGIEWDILNQEVMELYRTGKYERAVVVAKKALQVAEKALGPDHPTVAASLNNLAALYDAQGQYAQAEPFYKRSLAIAEKALGPDHPDVATSLENMAALYRATKRDGEAEKMEQRAARIRAIRR